MNDDGLNISAVPSMILSILTYFRIELCDVIDFDWFSEKNETITIYQIKRELLSIAR